MFAGAAWGIMGVHLAAKHKGVAIEYGWALPEEYLLIAAALIFSQAAMIFLDFVDMLSLTYADALSLISISALAYDLLPIIVKYYHIVSARQHCAGAPALSVLAHVHSHTTPPALPPGRPAPGASGARATSRSAARKK